MKPRLFPNHGLTGPLLAALLCQPVMWAATITWDGGPSGIGTDWATATNWTTDIAPADNISTDSVVFNALTSGQPNLAANRSVVGINFTGNNGALNWTLSGDPGVTLSLGSGGIDSTGFREGTVTVNVPNITMGSTATTSWSIFESTGSLATNSVFTVNSNIQANGTAQLDFLSNRASSGTGTGTVNLNGVISGTTAGGVRFRGSTSSRNTFNLGTSNTYTGTTTINQSTVNFTSLANAGSASSFGQSGTVVYADGNASAVAAIYTGSGSAVTDRLWTLNGTGGLAISNNSNNITGGALSLNNTGALMGGTAGNRALTLGGSYTAGSNTMAQQVSDMVGFSTTLTKNGTSTWKLTNTSNSFTGILTAVGGDLQMDTMPDGGVIAYNGGTVTYTGGSNDTSNRLIQIGTVGGNITAKLNSSGVGALDMTNTGALTFAGALTAGAGLRLGGTSTGENYLRASLGDQGTTAIKLEKADAGKWILTNNNGFTGGLSLSGNGTLGFSSDAALGASSGAVTFSGSSDLVATQGATIGSGRTITLNGSSAASFGITSAAGTTLDIAAKITGTGSVNRLSGSSSTTGVVRYSNPANDFTGDFNTRFGVVEFGSVANAGSASTIGAGSQVGISNGNSASVLRHVGGAGSSTNRNLVWTGGTGPLALESSGSGAIQWLGTGVLVGAGASSGAKTLTLGGSNTGLNELAQPINDTPAGGATSLVKGGAGTWRISGISSHTGSSTVESGKLLVDGNISTSDLSVATGAILGGSGTVGTTSISGIHSPGNSPGVQTVSNLTYLDGARIVWELVDDLLSGRGTSHDGIDVTGDLVFSGSTTVDLDFASVGSGVDWTDSLWDNSISGINGWKVFDLTSGTISGFANLSIGGAPWLDGQGDSLGDIRPNASFSLIQDGNDIYLNYANASAIPEPGGVLGLGALLGAGLLQRRRRPRE